MKLAGIEGMHDSNFPLKMLSQFFDKNSSINHSFSNDEIKFLSTRLEN